MTEAEQRDAPETPKPDKPKRREPNDALQRSVTGLVIGLLLIGLAAYEYNAITAWEADGGRHQLRVLFAGLYTAFGKWGVVGAATLAGLVLGWVSVRGIRRARR
ncbi:MAG: hypothetical protein AB7G15_03545 [Alphaproteobacteria bacterium]